MKKILLFALAVITMPILSFGQGKLDTKPVTNDSKVDLQKTQAYLKARNGKKTRGGSRNYSYVDAVSDYNTAFDTNNGVLWGDSTILTYFGTTPGYIWLRSGYQVMDPTAKVFNQKAFYPTEIEISDNDAYTLDSVGFIYRYYRNLNKPNVVDTMIVSVIIDQAGATNGTDLSYFWGTNALFKTRYGLDSMYINTAFIDFNRGSILTSSTSSYYAKIPMTLQTLNDSIAQNLHYMKIPMNINVPAGYQVGASISFKSGDTWTPYNDTLVTSTGTVNYNYAVLVSLIEDGGSTWRFYDAPDQNFSGLWTHDTTSWGTLYIPSVYYNNPFFDYHYWDYDITCNTCSPISTNDVANTFSNIKVFPNPTTTDLNIQMSEAKEADLNITVYSMTGKKLVSDVIAKGSTNASLNIAGLAAGIYLCELEMNGQKTTQKITKQ